MITTIARFASRASRASMSDRDPTILRPKGHVDVENRGTVTVFRMILAFMVTTVIITDVVCGFIRHVGRH